MSSSNDFIIKNGELKEYKGTGGNVTIPDGVTSISSSAFEDCISLTGVVIPDSVTYIGIEAFKNCQSQIA